MHSEHAYSLCKQTLSIMKYHFSMKHRCSGGISCYALETRSARRGEKLVSYCPFLPTSLPFISKKKMYATTAEVDDLPR